MALTSSRVSFLLRRNHARCYALRFYHVNNNDTHFIYEGWHQQTIPITQYYQITSSSNNDDIATKRQENSITSAFSVMSPKEEHFHDDDNGNSGDWEEESDNNCHKIQKERNNAIENISSSDDFDDNLDSKPANVEEWLSEYFWNDSLRLVRAQNVSVDDFHAAMFGVKEKENVSSTPMEMQGFNETLLGVDSNNS
mmetsp:Transcript_10100/g.15499  ORF Transcript_10100/g.15499 Transcript_10100/m.15499 type:complete len:196 (-) Transcript_10100:86-673(-)